MRKFILISVLFSLAGCAPSYRESFVGGYNLPVVNIKEATREGRACYYSGALKFWGSDVDFTIDSARRNGGVTSITAIEKEITGNLLLHRKCIIVRGN